MSKLSFRAKPLDAGKPMPIYMADELPDLPDYSAINRSVPQMPSGMKKEEECEHHLQRAICAGLIIPTPEVSGLPDEGIHGCLYPANYKQPPQYIHMQPFAMEQDIPDYDMDSEDERWLDQQTAKHRLELTPLKFEEMMDRLEKSSGQTVVSLQDAKALLKEDDDLIMTVFDYWLNKRLTMQHPLILAVKTEHRTGTAANNPYLAFRRRTEKMQTRKNRKNDETSYEKMLKLRRDLMRAVTLLELVKRREKTKREYVHLTLEIVEKRYQAQDFSSTLMNELSALRTSRPAFTPIFQNHYANSTWQGKAIHKDDVIPRKERRQYKKRKHKSARSGGGHGGEGGSTGHGAGGATGMLSSDDESTSALHMRAYTPDEGGDAAADPIGGAGAADDGPFAFRRNKLCSYHMPLPIIGDWPWSSGPPDPAQIGGSSADTTATVYPFATSAVLDASSASTSNPPPPIIMDPATSSDPVTTTTYTADSSEMTSSPRTTGPHPYRHLPDIKFRYTLTSITRPRRRCIGFARRRMGRGGRVILDRLGGDYGDEFWSAVDFSIYDNNKTLDQQLLESTESTQQPSPASNSSMIPKPVTQSCTVSRRNSSNLVAQVLGDTGLDNSWSSVPIKQEDPFGLDVDVPTELATAASSLTLLPTKDEQDEMIEFMQEVQQSWIHYRPKTPPSDYEMPCDMLPPLEYDSSMLMDMPFALELRPMTKDAPQPLRPRPLDDDGNYLLDDSPFLSAQFIIDPLPDVMDDSVVTTTETSLQCPATESVPITDTRQCDEQQQRSSSSAALSTVGCSTFTLSDSCYTAKGFARAGLHGSSAAPAIISYQSIAGREVVLVDNVIKADRPVTAVKVASAVATPPVCHRLSPPVLPVTPASIVVVSTAPTTNRNGSGSSGSNSSTFSSSLSASSLAAKSQQSAQQLRTVVGGGIVATTNAVRRSNNGGNVVGGSIGNVAMWQNSRSSTAVRTPCPTTANGMITPIGTDVSPSMKVKTNRHFIATGAVGSNIVASNANNISLNMHAAHSITLNSHSANVIDHHLYASTATPSSPQPTVGTHPHQLHHNYSQHKIVDGVVTATPIVETAATVVSTDATATVVAQAAGGSGGASMVVGGGPGTAGGAGAGGTTTTGGGASAAAAMVRKSNKLVMEVT